jgi:cysteine-rich repeat protein
MHHRYLITVVLAACGGHVVLDSSTADAPAEEERRLPIQLGPLLEPDLGECGNGILEPGEDCDVGGESAICDQDCTFAECGDGYLNQAALECCEDNPYYPCDDEQSVDDCLCPPSPVCGNGLVEENEQCDDGNRDNDDDCTTDCMQASCGDGYVQGTEECDEGDQNGEDGCLNDCTIGWVYVGEVSSNEDPTQPGDGVGSVWSYAGTLGTDAGVAMCQAIGAAGPCTYGQVKIAEQNGELEQLLPGTRFWIHRVHETVFVNETGTSSPPGPGGRCNDWTYPSGRIADSEWAGITATGDVHYYFDHDTVYTGVQSDGHAGPGYEGEIGQPGTGNGGNCGGSRKSILCCTTLGLP